VQYHTPTNQHSTDYNMARLNKPWYSALTIGVWGPLALGEGTIFDYP